MYSKNRRRAKRTFLLPAEKRSKPSTGISKTTVSSQESFWGSLEDEHKCVDGGSKPYSKQACSICPKATPPKRAVPAVGRISYLTYGVVNCNICAVKSSKLSLIYTVDGKTVCETCWDRDMDTQKSVIFSCLFCSNIMKFKGRVCETCRKSVQRSDETKQSVLTQMREFYEEQERAGA